jgi:hypothetical protein
MSLVLSGSTSGSVTLQEPAVAGTTVLDLPATSGNVVVDSATQTLTNKSIAATQLTGTIAAARLPTGSVLQVVNATTSAGATNNTGTPADTGLTASITPTSSSSKILVIVSQNGLAKNNDSFMNLNLLRNGAQITGIEGAAGYTGTSTANYVGGSGLSYLDSPATTSSTTYKTQFYNGAGGASVVCQVNSATSTITLMEIAA